MTAKADTLELRLVSNGQGSLKWTGGLFYKKTGTGFNDDGSGTPAIPASSWAALVSAASRGTAVVTSSLHTESAATIKQSALFGEVSNDFSDQFQLLAGGRMFKETRRSVTSWDSAFAFFSGGSPKGTDRSESTDSLFNPKVTASWKFSPDVLGYGTYSQGFRSGGQNDFQVYIPDSPADFKSEKLINQELGLKTILLKNSLVFNVSAYTMNWKNLQQLIAKGTGGIGSAIGNVGDARSRGVDLETKWVPTKSLEFNFAASVLDAKLDNAVVLPPSAGGITVPSGTRIPGTSKRTLSLGSTYRFPLSASLGGFLGGRISSRSDFTSDLLTYQVSTPGSTTTDLRFGVDAKQWQLFAFVDNAANKQVAIREDAGNHDLFSGQRNFFWARPRTIGINLRVGI